MFFLTDLGDPAHVQSFFFLLEVGPGLVSHLAGTISTTNGISTALRLALGIA
jgi:hypothetical protein